MKMATVPDLQNGFMILNYNRPNRWQTEIECVLDRQKDDMEVKRAYLSHECRAEVVHEDPFSHPGNHEGVGISTWTGNYTLRSGPSVFGLNPFKNIKKEGPVAAYTKKDSEPLISCVDRKVQYLRFEETIELLQSDFDGIYKKLYMELSYCQSGYDYKLYAPCRYLNFPNPESEGRKYLQPISGYVLYEKNNQFYISYVVSHVTDGITKSIQFKVRDKISFIEAKFHNHKYFKLFRMLDKYVFSAFFLTHDFYRTEKVNEGPIRCRFFCY